MLTAPPPQLAYEALAPSVAAVELPVNVTVGPVLAEGLPQGPVELGTFGLLGYRQLLPGALAEVWDANQKVWLPEGEVAGTTQLAYLPEQPDPWQGTVVAGGGTDAFGNAQFGKAVGGYPSYTFRALFISHAGEAFLTGPSAEVTFAGVADRNLMVLGPGEGEKPDEATEARLLLKNTGLQVIGGLMVRRDSPGAEVELSNSAGASVVLRPDGSIELRPASGRTVVVAGDLDTEHIVYRPVGGGVKKSLV
jgi:hypothetical protein